MINQKLILIFILLISQTVFASGGKKILKSASELDYPPFSIVRNGKAEGFSVELLKEVTKTVGLDVEFKIGPWNSIKNELIEGEIDLLPIVSYSKERDKVLDFTAPYIRMHGTVFIRKNNKLIRSFADLKNKEVLVMKGDTAHEYAIKKRITNKLILTDSFEEAMKLLSKGKHDALIIQRLVGHQIIKKLNIKNVYDISTIKERDIIPSAKQLTGFEQKFCIAVKEGDKKLLQKLNEGLSIVITNGKYKELYRKWFGPILPKPAPGFFDIAKYVLAILIPLLIFIVFLGVLHLKREVHRKTSHLKNEIGKRKKIETYLKESESIFTQMFEQSMTSTCFYTPEGKIIRVNSEFCKMFGVSKEGILNSDYNLFNDANIIESKEIHKLKRIFREKESRCWEIFFDIEKASSSAGINSTKKKKIYLEVHAYPVINEKSELHYYVLQHYDITKRRNSGKEIERQKKKAESYLNIVNVMFVGLDREGLVTIANKKACDILEYSPEEVIGKRWIETFIPENEREKVGEVFSQLIMGEIDTIEYYENNVISKTGKRKIIAWHNNYLRNEDNEINEIISAGEDITEKRRREKQIQKAQKLEAIGNLAGGIAHDFNNILFPIIGMSELLLDSLDSDSSEHEYANEIFIAGIRGSELVKQILAFSRQSDQKLIPVDIQSVLKEVVKLIRSTIPSNIEINLDILKDYLMVLGDPTQLHQIIMNLVTNAYHAVEAKNGKIDIKLEEIEISESTDENSLNDGPYAKLTVSDNGYGIDPEILDIIFEPYFTTKDQGKGTGLGLSVVHGLVKEHKGSISVKSEPEKGTEFEILLPLAGNTDGPESREKTEIIPTGSERILIVDDERAIARLEEQILVRLGYKVTTSTSSIEALDVFKSDPYGFDLVITDMTMPNLTGDNLSKEINLLRDDIPVIICTGFSEKIVDEDINIPGVKGVLMKPVIMSELAIIVRKTLDNKNN